MQYYSKPTKEFSSLGISGQARDETATRFLNVLRSPNLLSSGPCCLCGPGSLLHLVSGLLTGSWPVPIGFGGYCWRVAEGAKNSGSRASQKWHP